MLVAQIKLLELMAKKNIRTIEDLHERTGLSRTTIRLILNGKKKSLYFDTIAILCDVLDCEIQDLIVITEKEGA